MQTIKSYIDKTIKTTIPSDTNDLSISFNSSIERLDDDSIKNILLHIKTMKELIICKSLSKRFCRIINSYQLLENLFLSKYCKFPKKNINLSNNYLLSIDRQLQHPMQVGSNENNSLNIEKKDVILKKQLLFSIEKKLSIAEEVGLKNIVAFTNVKTVRILKFSEDNSFFTTGTYDGILKIYQFINDKFVQLGELNHEECIAEIEFSSDNNYLITSSYSKNIIWRLSTSSCEKMHEITMSCFSNIYFRHDNKRLLFTSFKGDFFKVYDLVDNQWLSILDKDNISEIFNNCQENFNNDIELNEITKQDKWLSFIIKSELIMHIVNVLCYYQNEFPGEYTGLDSIIYTPSFFKKVLQKFLLFNHVYTIKNVTYSNDMRFIYAHIAIAREGLVLEYNNDKWKVKLHIKDDGASYFSSDSQRFFTKYSNPYKDEKAYTITIWNIANVNKTYKELVLDNVKNANFSHDGQYIISMYANTNTIKIWHFVDSVWRVKTNIKNEQDIKHVMFSNYNWLLATILNNNTIVISEVINTGKEVTRISNKKLNKKIYFNHVASVVIQTDNIFFNNMSNCFITTKNNFAIIWRPRAHGGYKSVTKLEHEDNIENILFSHDNSHIIISSALYTTIWRSANIYNIQKSINCYNKKATIKTQRISYIDIKNDGKKLLIVDITRAVTILSLKNNNYLEKLCINNIVDIFFSSNSLRPLDEYNNDNWLKSGLQLGMLILLNKGPNIPNVNCSVRNTYLPERLAAYMSDVIALDIRDDLRFYNFNLYKDDSNVISYSQDKKLAHINFRNKVNIILENEYNTWTKKSVFPGEVSESYFSPDNHKVLTIVDCHLLIIWNITTDNAYQEIELPGIISAKFSPDNKYIVTSSILNTLQLWTLINDRWQLKTSIDMHYDIFDNVNFSNDSKFVSVISQSKKISLLFKISESYNATDNFMNIHKTL